MAFFFAKRMEAYANAWLSGVGTSYLFEAFAVQCLPGQNHFLRNFIAWYSRLTKALHPSAKLLYRFVGVQLNHCL